MSRRLHRAVNRWLGAERAAGGDSDTGLRRVFQALPEPRLPDGFADRVMLAAGLAPPKRVAAPLTWRIALAGALMLSGAAAATAPRVVAALVGRISPGDVIRFAAGALVETCQRLAEGLAVWQTANAVGETLTAALSSPSILTALLAATLLSAGGFRMLHGLLAVDRRSENARA